jgi:hypothetical protein
MQLPPNRKAASPSDRRDELRKARAAAPTLRVACPNAALVRVELAFQTDARQAHAPQAFSIYPPAKAHFVYACPFGDCDGSYDLNEIALGALQAGKRKTRGTLTCTGRRSRHGKSACPCELAATYSITVRHDSPEAAVSASPGAQP